MRATNPARVGADTTAPASPREAAAGRADRAGRRNGDDRSDTGTGLLTDRYELTMLQAALRAGRADVRCVFELFGRRLRQGRRYGVVAGPGRFLDALERYRFGPAELAFLAGGGVVDDRTLDWLARYRFTGDIFGYPEGECYFPGSPLLVVVGTFGEAVLLETLALSVLNHDCAVATAASRMVQAAGGRPLVEMGSRRTHEEAGVAAARAAYVAGFASSSNLAVQLRYGVPTTGTSAHAFTLLFADEKDAFAAQVAALGPETTLLVDTYDVRAAVAAAVAAAGPRLGAVRIDSGDLPVLAREVRAQLDALGATRTRIVVSGDLDEYGIAGLSAAPVDVYGVGTSVVTGSGAPTAELVYKLVARGADAGTDAPLVGVAKYSTGKPTHKGRKGAYRRIVDGVATAEVLTAHPQAAAGARPLLVSLVRGGEIVGREPLTVARERLSASLDELPPAARRLSKGDPAIPTVYEEDGDISDRHPAGGSP